MFEKHHFICFCSCVKTFIHILFVILGVFYVYPIDMNLIAISTSDGGKIGAMTMSMSLEGCMLAEKGEREM